MFKSVSQKTSHSVYKGSDNVTFSIFAADVPTQYRKEVIGLTKEGNPLSCIHYVEVK